jgi:methylated-DNA-[protein]-cysteine S-methyltransferase
MGFDLDSPEPGWVRDDDHPLIRATRRQLEEYFAGKLHQFNLPLDLQGTPFQKRVWAALSAIPYGETRTYSQLARQIGAAGAARAVGSANHANPVAIVVPCHRVIGADGALTGYGGGLDRKRFLLDLEGGADG